MPAIRHALLVLSVLALLVPSPGAVASGTVHAVSVSADGARGDAISSDPAVSADGRVVAFESRATNLVPGDTNGFTDIFVHDRETGQTTRASVSSEGEQANGHSAFHSFVGDVAISGDGRFVAFPSQASNIVPADTNGREDVFLHDRVTGVTELVSLSMLGTAPARGGSDEPSVSHDGRLVAFSSGASDLVLGDTNGFGDIFVRDRAGLGATILVSVSTSGEQANSFSIDPSISADGRFVAFMSLADNLVPGDTNRTYDVFVRDLVAGTTERVSLSSDGAQVGDGFGTSSDQPSISADGRFVAFTSWAHDVVPRDANGTGDVFVRDRQEGTTERVSLSSEEQESANGLPNWSQTPSISADGRFVAFWTWAEDLVPDDTNGAGDVLVRDRSAGTTTLVSHTGEGAHESQSPAISADGRVVAFDTPTSFRGAAPDQVFVHVAAGPAIDVKPGDAANVIVTASGGAVAVAVLGAPGFDAAAVDPASACFGDAGEPGERDCDVRARPAPKVEDVNEDGHPDLVLRFDTPETGIDPGDVRACLSAAGTGGPFEACDAVQAL